MNLFYVVWLDSATSKEMKMHSFQLDYTSLLSVSVQDEEGDFLAKLAKLVNGMGLQLILCWQK